MDGPFLDEIIAFFYNPKVHQIYTQTFESLNPTQTKFPIACWHTN